MIDLNTAVHNKICIERRISEIQQDFETRQNEMNNLNADIELKQGEIESVRQSQSQLKADLQAAQKELKEAENSLSAEEKKVLQDIENYRQSCHSFLKDFKSLQEKLRVIVDDSQKLRPLSGKVGFEFQILNENVNREIKNQMLSLQVPIVNGRAVHFMGFQNAARRGYL